MLPFAFSATHLTLAVWLAEFVVFSLVVMAWRARRVQARIDARLAPILKIRQAGVLAFRVRFRELSRPDWIDVEKVERLSADLRRQGFVEQGTFEVEPLGVLCRIHFHPQLGIAGVVSEGSLPLHVSVSLTTRYEDGTEFSYSGARFAGILDQPRYKTLVEVHEEEPYKTLGVELHEEDMSRLIRAFLAERPAKAIVHYARGQFAAWGEESYRREMDWRIERGGFTEDEIRRLVEAQGGEATPEVVAAIHERYRMAIEKFRQEPPADDANLAPAAGTRDHSIPKPRAQETASMLRFTIREWALLCIIVGLALGWGLDHWSTQMIEKRRSAQVQEMLLKMQEQILRDHVPVNQSDETDPREK